MVIRVCLSMGTCLGYCTDPDVIWGSGRGYPLVVQCSVDLQLVHELRCYGNIARTQNVSKCLYSLYAWFHSIEDLFHIWYSRFQLLIIFSHNDIVCLLRQMVVTNQMTTLVGEGAWQQVPSLGECWSHVPSQRVVIYWRQQQRRATLYKSQTTDDQTHVHFDITVSQYSSSPLSLSLYRPTTAVSSRPIYCTKNYTQRQCTLPFISV